MKKSPLFIAAGVTGLLATSSLVVAESTKGEQKLISPRAMADALHLVMDSDRTVYTRKIVNRLAAKEKVIKAS